MNSRRSWRVLSPLITVLVLAALWSIYWFAASSYARNIVEAERSRLEQRGLSLSCTKESWGGFPFRFEFACTSPVATWKNRAEIRSQQLLAVVLAYYPWQAVLLLDGPTTFVAASIPPRVATHERAIASITLERDRGLRVSADLPRLNVPNLVTASRMMVHSRPDPGGGIDVAASADELNYRPTGRPELKLERAELLGQLVDGSALNVEKVEFAEDGVRYWGSGQIGLDAQRRLSGKLSTQTNDLDGLLRILEPHLDISEQDKTALRTVLGLLGSEAKADIIARNGDLFIGPFMIARMQPLF